MILTNLFATIGITITLLSGTTLDVNNQTTISNFQNMTSVATQVCTDLELDNVNIVLFGSNDTFEIEQDGAKQTIIGNMYKGFWVIGSNTIYLNVDKNDLNTTVHELRHMWQYENGLFVNYIYASLTNLKAYRRQPLEQDARAFASAYLNNETCDYVNLMVEN